MKISAKEKKINIEYTANIFLSDANNKTEVWLAKPVSSEYQKIKNISITPKPMFEYKDTNNNKISYLKFVGNKKYQVKMNIQTDLFKLDNFLDGNYNLSNTKTKQFTQSEKYLEQTRQVKKLAYDLTKNCKNDLEKIKNIFEFVAKNFRYCYPVKKRGVINLNLNKLKGDCGEYSGLFVALCRSLKIPALNVTGFVFYLKNKIINEHGWASVYLKQYGWLDIDTQYTSLEKNIKQGIKKYFLKRSDYRISFINGFNTKLKPKISKEYAFLKPDFDVTKGSVQILQPIFVASDKKIKLKESFVFK